ncbi:hypothetical protein HJC23_007762 [Cyclotella cryptica]|uniref:VTT domain-containing protein n=1 Tax=Cyclotella cryptica TaxID=29204 RepID=A0ABD3R1S6_9STRA|eukprot:CCRYP_000033-RA/>CCRYP_000033-RA protein AED:0.02 eAED:0.02 QI:43/-1/1/1/-1/1/1/195/323
MRTLFIFLTALQRIGTGSSFHHAAVPIVTTSRLPVSRHRLLSPIKWSPRGTVSFVYRGESRHCERTTVGLHTAPWIQQRHAIKAAAAAAAAAALMCITVGVFPSPCHASTNLQIPSPANMQQSLVSILDNLSNSGPRGMIVYTLSFLLWTMTVGVTTPVETAAGMAFPLVKSIPLSAIGKIGGAFLQYSLSKYIFRDWARRKMKDNEWMQKIDSSFQSHPFRVALIWRFSPLPEFVKNIGPSLVPTLKTRYQILATLVHGLPFTVLWSIMGNEAAGVARGKGASAVLKRMVAIISWIGLFVSPTLFGWWIKGLGESEKEAKDR